MVTKSLLETHRQQYLPKLPKLLANLATTEVIAHLKKSHITPQIENSFPNLQNKPFLEFITKINHEHSVLRIGVVFSGGQASGGHNVISGLYDALKKMNSQSLLFGFLNGPSGIVENKYSEISKEIIDPYRNQGGFDLLGSGRTKIETEEQLKAANKHVLALDLDGLVIVGGDDSNTNAALLAEYFIKNKTKTSVIGVPKTIDGDLKNSEIEISFGFDTAAKTYSEIIGNLTRDALSAKKYYYFVKIMGRSASHLALECALQTQPNLTLISEEIQSRNSSLSDVINIIADLIADRAVIGKNYGVILIPEGLIEFIPEVKNLINELNILLTKPLVENLTKFIESQLSNPSLKCWKMLPQQIQQQLLIVRDSHGNVQVSKIETERMLLEMVKIELDLRQKKGTYNGKFDSQPLFCGYEGRSCFPSNFDCNYCYSLGHLAALLISSKRTGYLCSIKNTYNKIEEWLPHAVPLLSLMTVEERHGKNKPVIEKALVNLLGNPFQYFATKRKCWKIEDAYIYPGPIQFFGPTELVDKVTNTLLLEHSK